MSKPWDNEPTPRTDAARVVYGGEAIEALSDSVSVAFARSLEQQLRSAEGLLEQAVCDASIWYNEKTTAKIEAHLAAAREEDER